ncbi:MAG: hypothetical protein EXR59_05525 [Dehalococcoidia bacterium]|nr:hypothetical protein [Dehalococcoidia bacterium]
MQQQNGPQFFEQQGSADVYMTFFPHLDDFFVMDVRSHLQDGPMFKVMRISEIVSEDMYQAIERRLGQVLRERKDMASLMRVPERLSWIIQRRIMRFALRYALPPERLEEQPRVTIFIVTGQAVYMSRDMLQQAIEASVSSSVDNRFISDSVETLSRLFEKEKSFIKNTQKEQIREAIAGESEMFYSIWESRN